MQLTDQGYIINVKKYGESSAILTVITKHYGKLIGFVKNALTRKNLGTYQLGNLVQIEAYTRLEENMFSFKVELISPNSVNFITDSQKLSALSSFCSLFHTCLPEKEDIERLYYYVDSFIQLIHEDNWISHYSYLEFYLLEHLGVGLDLSECAATGSVQNLKYVSPKTGKAVSEEAGLPYHNRLFSYPQFIFDNNYSPSRQEIIDLLKMTGFFLNKNFFQTHNLKFPSSRANLLSELFPDT